MHHIDMDRQRHIPSQPLSRNLQDIVDVTLQLVRQPDIDKVDTRTAEMHLEENRLCNLDVTISNLPDELLAIIFKEGMCKRDPDDSKDHFGFLVSHVARRWRNIALETPGLWTNIRCIAEDDGSPYQQGKAATFLSRARLLPVDITIMLFKEENFSQDILQLIGDHIGHCGRLRIKNVCDEALMMLLECISSRPTHLLRSIHLSSEYLIQFREQLLPYGALRLTTVQLDGIDILTMHLSLHAFNSVTSLRLHGIWISNNNTGRYDALRDGLMSLKSLHHLELFVRHFHSVPSPGRLPIVLPTVQLLRINLYASPGTLSNLVLCVQAPSLIALWLENTDGDWENYTIIPEALGRHFPSLQHLMLFNIANFEVDLAVLSQSFPDIEHLTFQNSACTFLSNYDNILRTVLDSDSERVGHNKTRWSKLQTLAVSAPGGHLSAPKLQKLILKSQHAGRSIRKLMLPRGAIPMEDTETLAELEKLVEIDGFCVDWPTPFDWGD